MPDLGMYVIGKVEHGATARQVDHLATRREHVHPILDQIAAQPGDKGAVIIAIAAFQQLPHPRDLALEAGIGAATFLVAPMRGNTERSEEHTSELQSLMRLSY